MPTVTYLTVVRATARRELLIELRNRDGLLKTVLVALGVLLIFQFGLPRGGDFARTLPALIYSALFFAGSAFVLGNFEREENLGQMGVLSLAATDRGAVFIGKWLVCALLLTLCGFAALAGGLFLFGGSMDSGHLWRSALLILAGAGGYAGLGLNLSMAGREQRGGGAVAAILLPLLMPLFIALTQAQKGIMQDGDFSGSRLWLGVILLFGALFCLAPALYFDALFED